MRAIIHPADRGLRDPSTVAATTIYCLVREGSPEELVAALRAHYVGRAGLQVIVDRRRHDRRLLLAGTCGTSPRETGPDRRSPVSRRRPVVPRDLAGDLPPELLPHAASLHWVQRLAPVRRGLEHVDVDSLLGLVAQGHEQALSELYWRYFRRVAARVSDLVPDQSQADHAIQRAFGHLFDQLADFAPEQGSFEALVDSAVDDVVVEAAPGH